MDNSCCTPDDNQSMCMCMRVASLEKDVMDMKLVIMKQDNEAADAVKIISEIVHSQSILVLENQRCFDTVNSIVASINRCGVLGWRDTIGVELMKLRLKIKARVKKTKFVDWKTRVRHHRKHLILLTRDVDLSP